MRSFDLFQGRIVSASGLSGKRAHGTKASSRQRMPPASSNKVHRWPARLAMPMSERGADCPILITIVAGARRHERLD